RGLRGREPVRRHGDGGCPDHPEGPGRVWHGNGHVRPGGRSEVRVGRGNVPRHDAEHDEVAWLMFVGREIDRIVMFTLPGKMYRRLLNNEYAESEGRSVRDRRIRRSLRHATVVPHGSGHQATV